MHIPKSTSAHRSHLWPKGTAGSAMTPDVPTAHTEDRIESVWQSIESHNRSYETINYIYVLDDDGILVGICSIKDLLRYGKDRTIGSVCERTIHAVTPGVHREKAVYLCLKHGLKAVPVVDHHRKFLGVIPNDAIIHILYHEMRDDLLRFAGLRHPMGMTKATVDIPLLQALWHRLPWLILGLVGGLFMAKIIGTFEQTLAQNLILAAFIPLIVYMSSAVGTQMEAYIIRDLALEQHLAFPKYFFRQLLIVGIIAIGLGVLTIAASALLYGDIFIATTIGIALACAIVSSVFTGLLIPYAFSKSGLDPADASGPIATIVQDTMSIVIYLGIATWML